MGLDNYPARDPEGTLLPEDEEAFRKAGIRLCGGLFSDGTTSFRGEVYDTLVERVTGVTLYRGWIPPETVREMAAALSSRSPKELAQMWMGENYTEEGVREMENLQRFFQICAKRDLGLIAWW
jgi:hypothetical protein